MVQGFWWHHREEAEKLPLFLCQLRGVLLVLLLNTCFLCKKSDFTEKYTIFGTEKHQK